jgi:hypothetical protein
MKLSEIEYDNLLLTPKGLRKPKRPFADLGSVF